MRIEGVRGVGRRTAVLAAMATASTAVAMVTGMGSASAAVTAKPKPKTKTATNVAKDPRAAFQAYRKCLASHGVKLQAGTRRPATGSTNAGGAATGNGTPSITPPPGGFGGRPDGDGGFGQVPPGTTVKKWKAAQKACAKKRPKFSGLGDSKAFDAYRACLSRHGVTVSRGARPDQNDPKVQAAQTKCAALRPARPGGAGGASPNGSGSTAGNSPPLQLPS
ncbi:MAG: hypothetical protein U0V73_09590 [Acidimicrobiia bacterium]